LIRKDFESFAKLTMRDSNSLHAVCMNTEPPLFYLNDKSREVIRFVNEYNASCLANGSEIGLAYSFDAGPNAFLFALDSHVNLVVELIRGIYFTRLSAKDFFEKKLVARDNEKVRFLDNYDKSGTFSFSSVDLNNKKQHFESKLFGTGNDDNNEDIKYLIHSRVGSGPVDLTGRDDLSLIDRKSGLPIEQIKDV